MLNISLLADPRKLPTFLGGIYGFVGLVALLTHQPYVAGFWWGIGLAQVVGLRPQPAALAQRRWQLAVSAVALAAGLGCLALHTFHH